MKPLPYLLLIMIAALNAELRAEIDIPLTIRETGGVDRLQWPVTSGVPLPKGAITTLEKLQILDTQGRFVPARFTAASRWLEDGSLQWIHCDFAATVKAHQSVSYSLREIAPLPEFPSPIGFIPRGKEFEVITGPLRLVLGGDSNQLLDQVWVDEGWGYNFNEKTKILDSGNFDLMLVSAGRTYRTSHWVQNRFDVEEYNALRAVVKMSGSFALPESKEKLLDYVARLTVYGGKTYFKLDFTVLNPHASQAGKAVPVDELKFIVKMNLDPAMQRFTFGGDSSDYAGNLESMPRVTLIQESFGRSVIREIGNSHEAGDDSKFASSGWADLSAGELGLSVAVKWFRQLYPKAFEVQQDGTLVAKLFPAEAPGSPIFPARSRTHEMLFHFHGKRHFASGQVKGVLLGFQKPLYATAPARWYCQETQAFAGLAEIASVGAKPKFGPLASALEAWLVKSRDALFAGRDLSGVDPQGVDAYGVFRFANFFAFPRSQPNLGPTGDVAHALYLHFFCTGDLKSLELAEEVLAQVADVGMTAERSASAGLNVRAGAEGLFDSFLVTGNRRYLEAARSWVLSPRKEDRASSSQSTADLAINLLGLYRAYQVTGDRRALDNSIPLLEALYAWQDGELEKLSKLAPSLAQRWKEPLRDSLGETASDCGIVWEALRRYREVTGDKTVLRRLERAWDWILRNPSEWDPERKQLARSPHLGLLLVNGLAALSEETRQVKYWNAARGLFEMAAKPGEPLTSPDDFGLCFTAGQLFLTYLSKEFRVSSNGDLSQLHSMNHQGLGIRVR
jgi:YetA-like protein